jgi:hypothetical protein
VEEVLADAQLEQRGGAELPTRLPVAVDHGIASPRVAEKSSTAFESGVWGVTVASRGERRGRGPDGAGSRRPRSGPPRTRVGGLERFSSCAKRLRNWARVVRYRFECFLGMTKDHDADEVAVGRRKSRPWGAVPTAIRNSLTFSVRAWGKALPLAIEKGRAFPVRQAARSSATVDAGRAGGHHLEHFLEGLFLGPGRQPHLISFGLRGGQLHGAGDDYSAVSRGLIKQFKRPQAVMGRLRKILNANG